MWFVIFWIWKRDFCKIDSKHKVDHKTNLCFFFGHFFCPIYPTVQIIHENAIKFFFLFFFRKWHFYSLNLIILNDKTKLNLRVRAIPLESNLTEEASISEYPTQAIAFAEISVFSPSSSTPLRPSSLLLPFSCLNFVSSLSLSLSLLFVSLLSLCLVSQEERGEEKTAREEEEQPSERVTKNNYETKVFFWS